MSSTALEFGGGNFAQTTAGNGLFDVKQQIPFRASDIWPTAGKAGKSATLYTSSATFTVPTGVTSISVCCVGAGASGGIVRVAGGYTRCGGGGLTIYPSHLEIRILSQLAQGALLLVILGIMAHK